VLLYKSFDAGGGVLDPLPQNDFRDDDLNTAAGEGIDKMTEPASAEVSPSGEVRVENDPCHSHKLPSGSLDVPRG